MPRQLRAGREDPEQTPQVTLVGHPSAQQVIQTVRELKVLDSLVDGRVGWLLQG